MRLAPLLALVLVSAAGAQGIPDPTPPAEYYPLGVGNEWQYELCEPVLFATCYPGDPNSVHELVRQTIVGDTTVGAVSYFVETIRRYSEAQEFLGVTQQLLRFDAASVTVRAVGSSGEYALTCPLNADFGPIADCGGVVQVVGSPGAKHYQFSEGGKVYRAGIGLAGSSFWNNSFDLRYARVGGEVVFGTPLLTVASEAPPGASAFALSASPNPTAGPLAITVTLAEAQTVRLEAFDVLGRRVWHTEAPLGAGPQRLAVDASAWALGVYVVRAVAGRASATVRVVRR